MKQNKRLAIFALAAIGTLSFSVGATTLVKAQEQSVLNGVTFVMDEGASIRLGDVNGIRFLATISSDDYTDLEGLEVNGASVSYGMLIAPKDYVTTTALTVDSVFGAGATYGYTVVNEDGTKGAYVGGAKEIVNLPYQTLPETDGGDYVVKGSLVGIKEENLMREFVGLAYIAYTPAEGATTYRMADYFGGKMENNARSVVYAAQVLTDTAGTTNETKTQLKDLYLDKVAEKTSSYTVETYVGDTLVATDNSASDTLGKEVTADTTVPTGFVLDEEASQLTGKVYANGKLTLKRVLKEVEGYQVVNGGFENDLTGWTQVGDMLGGVSTNKNYWVGDGENADGYAFGMGGEKMFSAYAKSDNDSGRGTLTSSAFTVGGSGWVTFKLGGARDSAYAYIDVVEKSTGAILKRFWNGNWAERTDGVLSGCTLNAYKADLSAFLGKEVFFRVSDNATSNYGLVFVDSFNGLTYCEPTEGFAAACEVTENVPATIYDLYNGGFEMGNLNGWLKDGDIGEVSNAEKYWDDNHYFNKVGTYFFSAYAKDDLEKNAGTLRSSMFTVGGSGWITYLLSGVNGGVHIYMDIMDAATNLPLARFYNQNPNECTLIKYKADLSAFIGKTVYVQFTDHAINDYGLIFCDAFTTYYADSIAANGDYITATAIATNSIGNGGFETGNLNGWRVVSGEAPGFVSSAENYWGGSLNRDGNYCFHGLEEGGVAYEGRVGILRSTSFILQANGWISFKLGGTLNTETYLRVVNAATGETLAAFRNSNNAATEGTMVQYYYQFANTSATYCYVEIFDNATSGWGLLCVDSVVTDYTSAPTIEGAILATKI